MNIFQKIMLDQSKIETSLGCPAGDHEAIIRRQTHFATMTGGKGFRTPAKTPRRDAQGMTRGQRKRAAFERAFNPS